MVLPSLTSTGPSVHFTHPPFSLLKFTPASNTEALSPPASDHTFARPFNVDFETYNKALHPAVPITIAIVYATTVTYFNRINKERGHKPWAFSQSLLFYMLVVAHNAFLAGYSGWTFVGMFNAVKNSWPGWNGENGLAGAADALCKMHGPRGLGDAVTYNASSAAWSVTDKAIKLAGGRPDTTDVGRLWNEGVAFHGWLFYLSKFYEVVDTAIILAKGKKSSTLQTFHHTGAMLCLWAGIRYMSPPIWMFVFINSGLHTVMYSYYTLTTLTIQVPGAMKRVLTTLQIAQIVFGCSYALLHLFIAYDIPIEIPYLYAHNLSTALPSTASTLSSAVSSAFASATATAGLASWAKKVALRAAGEEGLAENVRNSKGETFGIDAVHAADVTKAQEKIKYRMGSQRVHCLDTSGEVFAILLNALYLMPLAFLFFGFFYKSYMARANSEPPKPTPQENIKEASKDAKKDVAKEIQEAMRHEQGGVTEPPPEYKEKMENAKNNAKNTATDLGEKAQSQAKDLGAKAKEEANDLSEKVKDSAGDLPAKVQQTAQDGASKAKDLAGDLPAKAQEMGAQAQQGGQNAKKLLADDLRALQEKWKKTGSEGTKPAPKEDAKTNGDSKSRDKSPVKAPTPRNKSPVKASAPWDKSTETASKSSDTSPVKRPTSRDKSPVKASAPREKSPKKQPQPANDPKPEPKESEETKPELDDKKNGLEEKKSTPDLGASGYEIVPDEPKTEEMRKAEAEMQPNQG